MIPKLIHYCWFGPRDLPHDMERYIDGWRSLCSDYALIRWSEANSPVQIPYLKRALTLCRWANASNFVRLYAVYKYGGIYLDTDVELLKPLDELLDNHCFFGWQKDSFIKSAINNAVFGAEPGHRLIRDAIVTLLENFDGTESADLSSPRLITEILAARGLRAYCDDVTWIDDIRLYPKRYFYPYWFTEVFSPACIRPDTHCIHHWKMSWCDQAQVEPVSPGLAPSTRDRAEATDGG